MERITEKDLKQKQAWLNELLQNHNRKVEIGHRYNYIALDLYDLKGKLRTTIITGLTKRQADDYLSAMITGAVYVQDKMV